MYSDIPFCNVITYRIRPIMELPYGFIQSADGSRFDGPLSECSRDGGHDQKYTYGTRGTPTTDALCNAINELENAAGTILVPSGLVAVTVAILTYLSSGRPCLDGRLGLRQRPPFLRYDA